MTKLSGIKGPVGTRYQSTGLSGRNRFPITFERILVPTDLTVESERAVEYGLVLAQRFGAHLTLLHVCKESYAVEYMRGLYAWTATRACAMHPPSRAWRIPSATYPRPEATVNKVASVVR